ncbi:MAG TPA: Hsp20/alpha crystallin family protein [Solirubrobacteraceae bacterium]|jgi:HSP20 family protein|nr:Hsp20/alpha crystallin family protein [Solirubrobacteraceae bacterium]
MPPERDLFANFERMRREIDELFGDFFDRPALAPHRRAGFTPPVDVSYADDPPRVIVTAALPGIRIDEVELEVQGRQLVIAGHRRPAEPEGRAYQQIEIEHGPFRRVIELGAEVATERTRATYENGMLHVELPLVPPDTRARTVQIEVSSSRSKVDQSGSAVGPGSSEADAAGPKSGGVHRRAPGARNGGRAS